MAGDPQFDFAGRIAQSLTPPVRPTRHAMPTYSSCGNTYPHEREDQTSELTFDAQVASFRDAIGPTMERRDALPFVREMEPPLDVTNIACNAEFRDRVGGILATRVPRATLARLWRTLYLYDYDLLARADGIPTHHNGDPMVGPRRLFHFAEDGRRIVIDRPPLTEWQDEVNKYKRGGASAAHRDLSEGADGRAVTEAITQIIAELRGSGGDAPSLCPAAEAELPRRIEDLRAQYTQWRAARRRPA